MRSAIWSTFACMSPPTGLCGHLRDRTGSAVVGREHRDDPRKRGDVAAVHEGLLWRVGQLLRDDAGDENGPVPLDLVDVGVGSDQAVLLQVDEALPAELVELDARRVGLGA